MALKDISRDCNECMQPFAGDVIEAIHRAIQSNNLQTNEIIRLMYPLGKFKQQQKITRNNVFFIMDIEYVDIMT